MDYDPIKRLNEIAPPVCVPGEIELELHRFLKWENVKKKECLLEINETCDRIWFIKKGLFRSFKKVRGKEEIVWFMGENDLMSDPQSLKRVEPSKLTIEALEDSIVGSITKKQLEILQKASHAFEHIVHSLTWEYYLKFMDYWENLTSGTIRHRYNLFLKFFPGLSTRVRVIHIASFLKCSTRSIHRVRKSKR
jgi:CRP-like cAMP-binding protein